MVVIIKGIMCMVKKKVEAPINGQMEVLMMVNGKTIKSVEKVY